MRLPCFYKYSHVYTDIRIHMRILYVHVYIHISDKYTFVGTYVGTYVRTYVRTYIRTYIYTYIRTYVRTYLRTYVRTYIRTYIHTYIRTYIHTYTHIHTDCYWQLCRPVYYATFKNELGQVGTEFFRVERKMDPRKLRLRGFGTPNSPKEVLSMCFIRPEVGIKVSLLKQLEPYEFA